MGHGGFEFADELGGGCLTHKFPGDIDGGDGRVYDSAFGDIVEACDGDIFRNLVAAELQGFDCSDGDEVVICEVGSGQRSTTVYDLQHIGECSLNRWRKFMNDGFCSGHSMFPDSPVKTVGSFTKVCDLIGGA